MGIESFNYCSASSQIHIRTTHFYLKRKDLVDLNFDISGFTKKIATNYFEGGRKGLSNKSKKNGFELLLVNSDNNVFQFHNGQKVKLTV